MIYSLVLYIIFRLLTAVQMADNKGPPEIIDLNKSCPSLKDLQNSYEKLKELCLIGKSYNS